MNTKALVTMMASIIAANAVLADDWTVSENTVLTADRTVDALTVEDGVTLDLNGYKLTCSALAGSGTITRTGSMMVVLSRRAELWRALTISLCCLM